ncbi:N-acetylmuramoyl-L-alanine amidase [Nocardioides cheoyonin]|uniref:N-acetylmuramoyl-L-alanine amidase n=1 Tax=Nocardioides cheoyonin TaxID=3156615 RepID=UPI0032B3DB5C
MPRLREYAATAAAATLLAGAAGLAGCGATEGSEHAAGPTSDPTIASTDAAAGRTGSATPSPSGSPSATDRAPKPKRARPPLAGVTVGIDPGHNGLNHTATDVITRQVWNGRTYEDCNTTGTATYAGYPESRFNFRVASFLASELRSRGARVVMTRTDDTGVGPCIDQRARIINRAHADVAIDIHADGGPDSGRGFAILQPVPSGTNDAVVPASRRYAGILRDSFRKTGMPTSTYDGVDGLTTRDDLAGLNLTTVPQVLLEAGNMRNAEDAAMLTSDAFQRKAAHQIAAAMTEFVRRSRDG